MGDCRLILAYNVRELNERENRNRLMQERAKRAWCSMLSWRQWMIDMYQSTQDNTHVEVAFLLESLPPGHLDRVRQKARETGKDDTLQAGMGRGRPVDMNNCVLAFAAFGDGGVTPVLRPFSNKAYQFLHLRVTRTEYHEALNFATDQIGKPFDPKGASWRLMIRPVYPTHKRWWCASLSHAILKRAGMLVHYPLNTLDVDDVVRLVTTTHEHRHIEGHMPLHTTLGANAFAGRMFYEEKVHSSSHKAVGAFVDTINSSCQQIAEV